MEAIIRVLSEDHRRFCRRPDAACLIDGPVNFAPG